MQADEGELADAPVRRRQLDYPTVTERQAVGRDEAEAADADIARVQSPRLGVTVGVFTGTLVGDALGIVAVAVPVPVV